MASTVTALEIQSQRKLLEKKDPKNSRKLFPHIDKELLFAQKILFRDGSTEPISRIITLQTGEVVTKPIAVKSPTWEVNPQTGGYIDTCVWWPLAMQCKRSVTVVIRWNETSSARRQREDAQKFTRQPTKSKLFESRIKELFFTSISKSINW